MDDQIQALLERWHKERDQAAFERAFARCRTEWWPMVHRRFNSDSTAQDVFAALLTEMLVSSGPEAPAAMAPPDHPNPTAFRRQAVGRKILDMARAVFTRQDYERGYGQDKSREAIRAERRQNRDARKRGQLPPPALDVPAPNAPVSPDAETLLLAAELRSRVVAALPRLPIRRRIAVALTGGFDPRMWVAELAGELGESFDAVAQRLEAALGAPGKRDLKVQVLFPGPPTPQSRNGWDQHLSRGTMQLREYMRTGEPS